MVARAVSVALCVDVWAGATQNLLRSLEVPLGPKKRRQKGDNRETDGRQGRHQGDTRETSCLLRPFLVARVVSVALYFDFRELPRICGGRGRSPGAPKRETDGRHWGNIRETPGRHLGDIVPVAFF